MSNSAGIGQFIPLILIFVIFYFFLIRPQQKKVKEHKAMVQALKRGDKVVTSGGIVGTVERIIDDDKVEVLISDNVKVEIVRTTGIQSLLNSTEQKKVKEHKLMVENLKRGDKVVTSGGIVGSIERVIDNDKVEVSISQNVTVEVIKSTGIQALVGNPETKK